ncbi:Pycsar system effector family protein [Kitasatospora sp. McL0602]|uniref:Pycsar system effector family protein n=1 Tax=Kitasatospora sp. McL0602 TaxID=3439530 RepID=UPI003F8C46EA
MTAHLPTPADTTPALARTLLLETREELAKADQKASLLLAALGVAVASVAGAVASADTRPTGYGILGQLLFWGGCLATTTSLALLADAVRPRLEPPRNDAIRYFGDLADRRLSPEQIRTRLAATDPVARDITQLALLAPVVATKYARISSSMTAAALALPLILAGILTGHSA